MTPDELVSKLLDRFPAGFQNEVRLTLRLVFQFQADHAYAARLASGGGIHDLLDFKRVLQDWADAAQSLKETPESLKETSRTSTCMRCFHVHEKEDECGVDLGKGGTCDCKAAVTA